MAGKRENKRITVPAGIVGDLAEAFDKSVFTIYRWISNNDDRLTSDKAKKVFAEHDFDWNPNVETVAAPH